MRDLSHKTTPLLSQFINSLPTASTISYSVWPRVQLPVLVFSLWALAVYSLHIRGYIESAGAGMGSVTGILSMGAFHLCLPLGFPGLIEREVDSDWIDGELS